MSHSPTCICQTTDIRIFWKLIQLKSLNQILCNSTSFLALKHKVEFWRSLTTFPGLEHFNNIIHQMICSSWLTVQIKYLTSILTHRKSYHSHRSVRLEQTKWRQGQPYKLITQIERLILISMIKDILNIVTYLFQWMFRTYI